MFYARYPGTCHHGGMSFTAQYPGVCCQCGEAVVPGQVCRYWGDEDQEVGHVACTSPLAPGRNEKRCGACFTTHAGECA